MSPRGFSFIGAALCSVLLLSAHTPVAAAEKGAIKHIVIFWLKRPGNIQDRTKLARASEKFRALPGVVAVEVGRALPVRRTGIEQPFDLCAIFTFRNQSALDRFESDPQHQEAVKSVLRPLVKHYAVFNSLAD